MKNAIRFFANQPTLAYVFTFLIIFIGVSSLSVIQRDNFPSVDMLEMTVTTRYPGASPEDVELNVTNEIEEELKEVDGIDRYTSFSMENISIVHIWIDREMRDKNKVKTDIRDAVSRVSGLPIEVDEDPVVEEITTSASIPVIEVGLTGDVPYALLRTVARRTEKALRALPGVRSVNKYGYLDREIKVEISNDALERYAVSAHEIVTAIQNRNIRATGGSFESYTSEKNIVTLAEFEDPMEAADVIVRLTEGGSTIRVKDLALLRDDFEPAKVLSRMNGTAAISFEVFKKESSDIIRTVDAVKQLVAESQTQLPEGISIEYSNDKSRLVKNRLSVVVSNGLIGLGLVMLMLSIFLNWHSAFWVALSIPVVLLGTLFLLPIFGAFLDTIAMGAMILIIGIVVDDGIVVAENIWRSREMGMAPLDAAVEGTNSVAKPVITTVVTTALAFTPMFFMTGMLGDFIYVIPLVVVLALSISLLDTLFIMPAHLISGAHGGRAVERPAQDRWFVRFREVFRVILQRLLPARYAVIAVFVGLMSAAFLYAAKFMDFVLFPTQSADEFYILAELPSGSSLQHTEEKIQEVEALMAALPETELASYTTRIGTHGWYNLGENENWALMGVYLTAFAKRDRNADQIVDSLRAQTDELDGFENFTYVIDSGGPPIGRPVQLRIIGSDDQQRRSLADTVVAELGKVDGVSDIERDDKLGKEQIVVDLDYIRLAEQNLSVADVARNLRLAYDGEIVTSVRYGDEDVDFRVILEEEARGSAEVLGNLVIPNRAGRFVKLQEVADFRLGAGPSNFYHYDNERTITVTANIDKGKTTSLLATTAVLRAIDIQSGWPGMRIIPGGEAEETQKSMASLVIAFAIAAVGIYLVLLLLFNSLTQPLVVMFAVPFGLIGVIFAFAIHGEAIGFLAMLGVIGLVGIVVNDSLILVNLVNRMREMDSAVSATSAVVQATKHRLRPILLTSVTTVAGLLPMAYGIGGSDPFSAPMALAMGYGILFATPLTLILIPCLLLVQDDVRTLARKAIRKVSREPQRKAP
ncbi:MAG: efflux RND transporter permease subunit [Gammaproteobacteria bacterium]|nr:efflux RND transporter permease subunit [Gammaproteobacteria bacterium]